MSIFFNCKDEKQRKKGSFVLVAIRVDRRIGSVPVGCEDVNLDCLLGNRVFFIDDRMRLWSESMANKE